MAVIFPWLMATSLAYVSVAVTTRPLAMMVSNPMSVFSGEVEILCYTRQLTRLDFQPKILNGHPERREGYAVRGGKNSDPSLRSRRRT